MQIKNLNTEADSAKWFFDSKKFSIHHFNDENTDTLNQLTDRIAQTLSTESDYLMLEVKC